MAILPYIVLYYPGQENHYSRDNHEVDLQLDLVKSFNIEFDLQDESSRRAETAGGVDANWSWYRATSHDQTEDQPHDYLGCTNFLARVVWSHVLLTGLSSV